VRISKLQNWLKEETAITEPPTLADVVRGILERNAANGNQYAIQNLKAAANTLNFLTTNKIMNLAGLDDCFKAMLNKQFDMRDNLKPIERRLDTLDKHIKQAENYKEYRSHGREYKKLYAEYETLRDSKGFGVKRKAEKARDVADEYYKKHRMEVTLFNTAEQYIAGVMNDYKGIPVKKWNEERTELITAKKQLNIEYRALKTEVSSAEKIRSEVYSIIRQERRREQPERDRDMER
jgi:hypothetical protein